MLKKQSGRSTDKAHRLIPGRDDREPEDINEEWP
mgnify:CR=1 FL=1